MSDGPSDCADRACSQAHEFAAKQWPALRVVGCVGDIPATGKVVLIYEAWLDHVVEIIDNRLVAERWLVGPGYLKPEHKQLAIPADNGTWQAGYYQEHTLYENFKEGK